MELPLAGQGAYRNRSVRPDLYEPAWNPKVLYKSSRPAFTTASISASAEVKATLPRLELPLLSTYPLSIPRGLIPSSAMAPIRYQHPASGSHTRYLPIRFTRGQSPSDGGRILLQASLAANWRLGLSRPM